MKFIAIKIADGLIKDRLSFSCRMLHVSHQGFYKHLENKDRPWKYQSLAEGMLKIQAEDEYNDTYDRIRMHQAINIKKANEVDVPSEKTVYRVSEIRTVSQKQTGRHVK